MAIITGTANNDVLAGLAAEDDIILAGAGNDVLRGFAGDDELFGEDGNDVLDGGADDDRLDGGRGTDVLFGGAGRDTLTGGAGEDVVDGGAGTDTAVFSGNRADYEIRTILGVTFVRDLKPLLNGNDGIDVLVRVERLQFADEIVFLTPNRGPIAQDDAAATDEDQAITIAAAALLANDSDADRDPLTIIGVTDGAHGTTILNADGSITYTPDGDFNGSDEVTYTLSDGYGGTTTAKVAITVNAVNDAPVANNDETTVAEGGSVGLDVLANDSDPDNTLTAESITAFTQGAYGSVVQNPDGTFTYAHDGSETTADSFTYTITDGEFTRTATVDVDITPVNDAPEITGGTATGLVQEDTVNHQATGQLAAVDPDNGAQQIWSVTGGTPRNNADYQFRMDSLTITRNGNLFFFDDFTDGDPPPDAPNFAPFPGNPTGVPASYGGLGAVSEVDGNLVFDSDNTATFNGTQSIDQIVGQNAVLRSSIDGSQNGLKKTATSPSPVCSTLFCLTARARAMASD